MFTKRFPFSKTDSTLLAAKQLRRKHGADLESRRSHDEDDVQPKTLNSTRQYASHDAKAIRQEVCSLAPSPTSIEAPGTDRTAVKPTPSLLDSLPAFMALSAAQIAMQQGSVTDRWMHLAAGYMVQAVAEQYFVYGNHRPKVVQRAFAWGFNANCNAEEGSDEWQINAMFFGEDGVVNGWDQIRDEHMKALEPSEGIGIQEHLGCLLENDLSMTRFEECIFKFLTGLHLNQPRPVLQQIESGKGDDLPREIVQVLREIAKMS